MFVGFIAVVVILLVIVGLMSEVSTEQVGGTEQTRASKAVSELAAMRGTANMYKIPSLTSDYAGLSVTNISRAGLMNSALDGYVVTGGEVIKENTDEQVGSTVVPLNTYLIKSQSIPGLYFKVRQGATGATYYVSTIVNPNLVSHNQAMALESAYLKVATKATAYTSTSLTDGCGLFEFSR